MGTKEITAVIESKKQEIIDTLADGIDKERFMRIVLSEFTRTPNLMKCTKESVLQAVVESAQLGLEVGKALGHCYFIPYGTTCQLIIGYKGLLAKAYSDAGIKLSANVVYENDVFEWEQGIDPKLKHVPSLDDRGNPIAVYSLARHPDGEVGIEVMSWKEIQKIKMDTKGGGKSGPWAKYEDEMARKTVIRRHTKYLQCLPASIMDVIQKEDDLEYRNSEVVEPAEPKQFGLDDFTESEAQNQGHNDTGFEPEPPPPVKSKTAELFGSDGTDQETGEIKMISDKQIAKIKAMMREKGMDGNADLQQMIIKEAIGHEVKSSKDMSMAEGSKLIKHLISLGEDEE